MGGGGYFRVGMCHWDPETLSLVQLNLSCSQAKLNFAAL